MVTSLHVYAQYQVFRAVCCDTCYFSMFACVKVWFYATVFKERNNQLDVVADSVCASLRVQAIKSYAAALDKLSDGKIPANMTSCLQHSVSWDLSSVYYTIATALQDYAPVSSFAQEQV
jgi:hypothetical protein